VSGLTLDVEINDAQFKRRVRKALRKSVDMEPAFEEVGEYMVSSITQTFHEQGRPQRWQPLSPVTLYNRAGGRVGKVFKKRGGLKKTAERKILGAKILMVTGRLLRSIHRGSRHGRDYAEVGTNVAYAAIHHFGGKAGRGKQVTIPARPYMQILPEDEQEIRSIFSRYLDEALA